MRIALISGNSQGVKNGMIYNSLKKVADQYGFEVGNYGMYTVEDEARITYVQAGILAAAILNGKAANYVIMGYGTGGGATLARSSLPGAICSHVEDALDAYTSVRIDDGNVIATPFARGFGWGGDLSLEHMFEKLFCEPSGQGYPRERAVPEQRNKRILDDMRRAIFREDPVGIFKGLDQEPARDVFAGEKFGELFFGKCKDERLAAYVRESIG